jgi:hypothetical protein
MKFILNITLYKIFYDENFKVLQIKGFEYFFGLMISLGIIFMFAIAQLARTAVDYFSARWALLHQYLLFRYTL